MCTSLTSRQILKLPDAGHLLLITGGPELLKIIRRKADMPLPAGAWPRPERESAASAGSTALPDPLIPGDQSMGEWRDQGSARAKTAREGGALAPCQLGW